MVGYDLLGAGIYTVPDAARLLRVSHQKVRGWVAGYPRTKAPPIIRNEVGVLNNRLAMSFINLMEARFIAYFASFNVHVTAIRYMAEEAKSFLQHPHPFATNAIFTTDGRKIFAAAAEHTGDKWLYDLRAKNWALYEIVVQSLKKGVIFDPKGVAATWFPRDELAPNVILHPKIAFGQPVLKDNGVPTRALFDAFHAEGETYETVAHWYDVPPEQVEEAVRFELDLSRAA